MDGCSLEDAFGGSFPAKKAGKTARREEREKAKKCKGPALTFLEKGEEDYSLLGEKDEDLDPDRQSFKKTGFPAKMNSDRFKEGFANMLNPSFISEADKPLTAQEERALTLPSNVPSSTALPVPSAQKPAYFGADPLTEGFAPYSVPYTMQVDFKDSFKGIGTLGGAGAHGKPLGAPGVNDVWGGLMPEGGINSILTDGKKDNGISSYNKDELSKKIDTIFARLDDLESGRNATENAQTEVLLFVMTGVFIIFSLDLISKR
jgi:hypothetical protein